MPLVFHFYVYIYIFLYFTKSYFNVNTISETCMYICLCGCKWMLFECECMCGCICVDLCVCLWLLEHELLLRALGCALFCLTLSSKLCFGADPHYPDIISVSSGVSAPGRHRPAAGWHSRCHYQSHWRAGHRSICAHCHWSRTSPHRHWPASYSRSSGHSHDHCWAPRCHCRWPWP